MTRRDAIETAFRRLPISQEGEQYLPGAVGAFDMLDTSGLLTPPPAFSVVGKVRTQKELDDITMHLAGLARCLDSLHQPAILAMAEVELCNMRHHLPKVLHDMAAKMREIDLSDVPEKVAGGRPENIRANGVVAILAYYYELLTGEDPTRRVNPYRDSAASYGPFEELVGQIFSILGIYVNTEHAAREAIFRYNNKKREAA